MPATLDHGGPYGIFFGFGLANTAGYSYYRLETSGWPHVWHHQDPPRWVHISISHIGFSPDSSVAILYWVGYVVGSGGGGRTSALQRSATGSWSFLGHYGFFWAE